MSFGICLLIAGCVSEGSDRRDSLSSPPATSATGCSTRLIREDGVGALKVGADVDSVRAHCQILRDTVEERAEGLPTRIITVRFGPDSIEAEVVDGRVWRIEVAKSGFATADSLGVGTRLGQLARFPGAIGENGEGELFIIIPAHCGLSFRIDANPGDTDDSEYDSARLATLKPQLPVDMVLITGCSEAAT